MLEDGIEHNDSLEMAKQPRYIIIIVPLTLCWSIIYL